MKRLFSIIVAILLFTLCGCSDKQEVFNESSIAISKKGEITNTIVESFAEDYYTEDGLRTFFNEKISDTIGISEDESVNLTELTVEEGTAKAVLTFSDYKAYNDFYSSDLFYGSVNDAYDSGYILDTTLKAVDSTETISKFDIMKKPEATIIIVSEPVLLVSPKRIVYTSANVEIIDEKHVRISSDSSGFAYMITEK